MSVISGVVGAISSKEAAGEQADAAKDATQAQLQMYYKSREDLTPWRESGARALGKAEEIIAGPPTEEEFAKSPSYNFLVGEGTKALTRTLEPDSGRALKEAIRYGQGLASTQYSNYLTDWLRTQVNPQLAMAGMGQVAATSGANAALQTGQGVAQNALYGGQARASGYINQANAITGALNAAKQGYEAYKLYNYLTGPSAGYGSGAVYSGAETSGLASEGLLY